jgi:hypothetical protein
LFERDGAWYQVTEAVDGQKIGIPEEQVDDHHGDGMCKTNGWTMGSQINAVLMDDSVEIT